METEEEAVPHEPKRTGGAALPLLLLLDYTAACCHGGAKMAVLAYSLGKREINQHFTIKNAKLISLAAVLLLLLFHTALRHYGGGDSCEWLLSKGRYLGENVWQPYGCMMHKYKSNDATTCLSEKQVVFAGDSRIRQLFYSFVKIIKPETTEDGNKHEDIFFQDQKSSLNVDFLWYPEANNSMKDRVVSWTHVSIDTASSSIFKHQLNDSMTDPFSILKADHFCPCLDCLGQFFLDPLHMSRNTTLCHI